MARVKLTVELRYRDGTLEKRVPESNFPAWRLWRPVPPGFSIDALKRDPDIVIVWCRVDD